MTTIVLVAAACSGAEIGPEQATFEGSSAASVESDRLDRLRDRVGDELDIDEASVRTVITQTPIGAIEQTTFDGVDALGQTVRCAVVEGELIEDSTTGCGSGESEPAGINVVGSGVHQGWQWVALHSDRDAAVITMIAGDETEYTANPDEGTVALAWPATRGCPLSVVAKDGSGSVVSTLDTTETGRAGAMQPERKTPCL